MRKLILLLLVLSAAAMAQYDAPSDYTNYYGLRLFGQGDNPSADSLNQNWRDIDEVLYDLIIYVDETSFEVRNDTLFLTTEVVRTDSGFIPTTGYKQSWAGVDWYGGGANFHTILKVPRTQNSNNPGAVWVDTTNKRLKVALGTGDMRAFWPEDSAKAYMNENFLAIAGSAADTSWLKTTGLDYQYGTIEFKDPEGGVILEDSQLLLPTRVPSTQILGMAYVDDAGDYLKIAMKNSGGYDSLWTVDRAKEYIASAESDTGAVRTTGAEALYGNYTFSGTADVNGDLRMPVTAPAEPGYGSVWFTDRSLLVKWGPAAENIDTLWTSDTTRTYLAQSVLADSLAFSGTALSDTADVALDYGDIVTVSFADTNYTAAEVLAPHLDYANDKLIVVRKTAATSGLKWNYIIRKNR